jgi:hypothetical protein
VIRQPLNFITASSFVEACWPFLFIKKPVKASSIEPGLAELRQTQVTITYLHENEFFLNIGISLRLTTEDFCT